MRLQVGRIDRDGPMLGALRGQSLHHPGKDPHFTPPIPSVVERLRRAILMRRIVPPQPIATEEDYPTQHTQIVDPRPAMALRKEWLHPLHLLVRQTEMAAHHNPCQSES